MASGGPRSSGSEPLHQQVARNIRNQIQSGRLRHGDALPSTRDLAAQWDVSVFTINEAMRVLAEEGLVISRDRSKRVVNAPEGSAPAAWRPASPQVVLIGGYAGSGKSELARILARQAGWPMIDKDTITRPVVEMALEVLGRSPNDRESDIYLEKVRPGEYDALIATTLENIECGNSVIAAAPFLREFRDQAWLDRTKALFDARNAKTTVVWVYCDAETMHRYVRHRGAARDAAKLSDWSNYSALLDLDFRPAGDHEVIDNSASSSPLQAQAAALLDRLAKVQS